MKDYTDSESEFPTLIIRGVRCPQGHGHGNEHGNGHGHGQGYGHGGGHLDKQGLCKYI